MLRVSASVAMTLAVSGCGGIVEAGGGPPPNRTDGGGSGGSSASGCSLEPLASGALPPALSATGLSGPVAVATENGFVIGYREQDGIMLRAVIIPLSDTGTLGTPTELASTSCGAVTKADRVGMAYAANHGLFVSSVPNCGQGAGASFVPFDANAIASNPSAPQNSAFDELTLSAAPVAASVTPGEYDFVYRVVVNGSSVVERIILQGAQFKLNVPIVHPFGEDDHAFAMIASSPSVRALAAPFQTGIQVHIGPNTGDDLSLPKFFPLPLADWAALHAWDDHVAALVPHATPVGGGGFVLSSATLSTEAVTATIGAADVRAAALATLGDHLFVLAGAPDGLHLYDVPGASTKPQLEQASPKDFQGSIGSAPIAGSDGAHVAMAAARGRVLVVWLSGADVTADQPTGGWALLACPE